MKIRIYSSDELRVIKRYGILFNVTGPCNIDNPDMTELRSSYAICTRQEETEYTDEVVEKRVKCKLNPTEFYCLFEAYNYIGKERKYLSLCKCKITTDPSLDSRGAASEARKILLDNDPGLPKKLWLKFVKIINVKCSLSIEELDK